MRGVSRGHVTGRRSPAVFGHTRSVPADRKQLGHRRHDAVHGGCDRYSVSGGRVRQAQPHAHREGRRPRGVLRALVRHTVVLHDHIRARSQANGHRVRRTKVNPKTRFAKSTRGVYIDDEKNRRCVQN